MKRTIFLLMMSVIFATSACSAQEKCLINADGVGPVKIGMTAKELPASVPGLYDKIVEENSDFVLYSFYLNGTTVMTTNGDGKIELIEVFPELTQVTTNDGVHPGMTAADFKKKSGWKAGEADTFSKDGVTVYLQDGEITNMQVGSYEADW